jgi:ligand-binding sensor domain-containing protein
LAGGQLSAFDGREWITHTERLPIEPPVTALVVTGDGAVWAGAQHGGLARYDGQCWTEYGMADGLPSERIVDLVVAPDDVLWAITDEGLVHFNGDAWQSVWLGHDCGALNAMGFAPDGSVWLGTSRGAVHFQPQHGPT